MESALPLWNSRNETQTRIIYQSEPIRIYRWSSSSYDCMIVPSNAEIFTLFRQFCKMDWAWEKQDHPKHQPGILSSFYMFLQHGKKTYREYSVEIKTVCELEHHRVKYVNHRTKWPFSLCWTKLVEVSLPQVVYPLVIQHSYWKLPFIYIIL